MASTKISALPAASTTTAPDLYPLVQSGANFSITFANLRTSMLGSARSVNVVFSSTAAGANPMTDYYYFVTVTATITMPTAAGNTNLYTIKKVGSGVVTINTTSSQTIDGSPSASIPVPFTSLTLLSDGSNWNIV
jgi:hypothetical protein